MSFRPAGAITLDHALPTPPQMPMPMPALDMAADDPASPLPDVPLPAMADVEAAARQVAEASASVEEARAPLAAAQAHRDRIAGRIDALEAERSSIVSRRAQGDECDDDAARLALIAADTEGLRGLLATAEGALVAPRDTFERAKAALATARMSFDRTEAEATESALVGHADHLAALLLTTVQQVAEASKRIGRGLPAWAPSAELYNALRKLAIQRRVI